MNYFALHCLAESVVEGCDALLTVIPKFDTFVTDDVTQQCCLQLKNVNDIPRLYRRTNREVHTIAIQSVKTD